MKPILFNTDMVRAILKGRKTVTRRVVKTQPNRSGDILYVRETWRKDVERYMYKADYSETEKFYRDGKEASIKWRHSIHMPREAARIFLRVTRVYPQQLRDVTEEDAKAEGFGSRAEFVSAILKMYPDCTEDSWFWVNEFKRCENPEEA